MGALLIEKVGVTPGEWRDSHHADELEAVKAGRRGVFAPMVP